MPRCKFVWEAVCTREVLLPAINPALGPLLCATTPGGKTIPAYRAGHTNNKPHRCIFEIEHLLPNMPMPDTTKGSTRHLSNRPSSELKIPSEFDNSTEPKSFVRHNTLTETGALNIGIERTGRVPEHRMVPHIQKLTLKYEV